MSLFGEPSKDVVPESRIKDIRQAMLDSIVGLSDSHQFSQVWARVLYAPDIQALWYLRSDLMTLLSGLLGERTAGARLATISRLFEGQLPSAQKSRPNSLGN